MAKMPQDQEFVEYLVKSIVNNADEVKTERKIDERGVLITLKVNPADFGIVIGKQGRTIQAIRTLARVAGAKANARVNIKLEEVGEGKTQPSGKRGKLEDVELEL